jgi:hypothetical protein
MRGKRETLAGIILARDAAMSRISNPFFDFSSHPNVINRAPITKSLKGPLTLHIVHSSAFFPLTTADTSLPSLFTMATFRDLPPEIRRMIWRHYLEIPRVLALEIVRENWQYRTALYGERSWLHHVNREARREALLVQQCYSPNHGELYESKASEPESPEPLFYANFETDVIWLVDCPDDGLQPGEWHACVQSPYTRINAKAPWSTRTLIPRLAVSPEWWVRRTIELYEGRDQELGFVMKDLHDNGVTELLLVVNEGLPLAKNREIVLRGPSKSPRDFFTWPTPVELRDDITLPSTTWEQCAQKTKETLNYIVEKHKEKNEEFIDGRLWLRIMRIG